MHRIGGAIASTSRFDKDEDKELQAISPCTVNSVIGFRENLNLCKVNRSERLSVQATPGTPVAYKTLETAST